MPRATVSKETEKKELKSCPGGFVILRRMDYGQSLTRREMAATMRAPLDRKGRPDHMEMNLTFKDVYFFDFRACVVDHNLEDDNDQKLDLQTREGFSQLDPNIAVEIEDLIESMNPFISMVQEETEDGQSPFRDESLKPSPPVTPMTPKSDSPSK
jgi:hypothetical protein